MRVEPFRSSVFCCLTDISTVYVFQAMAVLLSTIFGFFKDEPKLIDRGRNALQSGHTLSCTLKSEANAKIVNAKIQASMKNTAYDLEVSRPIRP